MAAQACNPSLQEAEAGRKWRPDWVSERDYTSKILKYIKFEKIKNKKGYFTKKHSEKKKCVQISALGPNYF